MTSARKSQETSRLPFTSQKELFAYIAVTRPWVSEIGGEPLVDLRAWNFMHVLRKGKFPRWKYHPWNVIIGTRDEHDTFDNYPKLAATDPQFDWLFEYRWYLLELDRHLNHVTTISMVPEAARRYLDQSKI